MEQVEHDHPGVIARPPLIYLAALAVGLVPEFLWPSDMLSVPRRLVLGLFFIASGASLMGLAIREFKKAETHFRTDRPVTAIITTGPFRITRNPIYIALSLIYVGIAVGLDSLWVLAMLVPVLIVIRYGVIAREERYLESKFGDGYRSYKSSVRRWL
ncbi:MAG: isoprenylcysteine carboxylmethyltransferase family protein [Alphaproteobacteria bacterium]|jgi:protein-S-isoprenylcysteine O-methyltransferase Ste14